MMKIAVPVHSNNMIDNHFGHCKYYKIFSISDENKIIGELIHPSTEGCGCKSNIASELAEENVNIMLAGGIGRGAVNKLNSFNIEVIRNCQGDVNKLVERYLAGEVIDGGENCATHEHHHGEGGHVCNH